MEMFCFFYGVFRDFVFCVTFSILFTIHFRTILMFCWAWLDDQSLALEDRQLNLWYDKVFLWMDRIVNPEYDHLGGSERSRSRSDTIGCCTPVFAGGGVVIALAWPLFVLVGTIGGSSYIFRELVRGKKKITVLVNHAHKHSTAEHELVNVREEAKKINTPFPGTSGIEHEHGTSTWTRDGDSND